LTERIPLVSLLEGPEAKTRMDSLSDRVSNGAVFVYPTETIYGIGARADSPVAEQRIRSIKERRKPSPFILIASDMKYFDGFGLVFPQNARKLADRFWPGNLTLILQSETSPNGVGIRVSDHPFITALYKVFYVPVFSTSANISDTPYVNDPDSIFRMFDGRIDFMVDAGTLTESKPSTIVRVNGDDTIEMVREGAIRSDDISRTVNHYYSGN
jgi:L-threonylcarbamoyladenylate synthase